MTITPLVAIVAMLCLLVVTLVAIFRVPPEHIPKILQTFTRWFGR
jgi:hypothetical protein